MIKRLRHLAVCCAMTTAAIALAIWGFDRGTSAALFIALLCLWAAGEALKNAILPQEP